MRSVKFFFIILILGIAVFGVAVWMSHGEKSSNIDLSRNALIYPTKTDAPVQTPVPTPKIKAPKNIYHVAFSKDFKDVAYVYFDDTTGEGNISIANADFSSYKILIKTRIKEWQIAWVDDHTLSLISAYAQNNLDSLLILDIQTKTLSTLIQDRKKMRVSWGGDGDVFLLSDQRGTKTVVSWASRKNPVLHDLPSDQTTFTYQSAVDSKSYSIPFP